MSVFQLTKPTTALLASVTPHAENHGDDKVPAVSLGLQIQTSAAVLDMLCPDLRPMLGVPGVETIALKIVCEGWTVNIEHGIDETAPIKLGGCRIDKFKVAPGNDDQIDLRLRVGSHDLTPMNLGLVSMKIRQDIVVTITAPKVAMQTNSDAQTKAMKQQREQEAAGQKRVDAPDPFDTPERALARAVGAKTKGKS